MKKDTIVFYVNETMGGRFKQVREHYNETQKEFSYRIKISQAYIALIEHNKKKPTYLIMKSLLLNLNVSIDWLLTGEGIMFRSELKQSKVKARVEPFNDIHIEQAGFTITISKQK